MSLLINKQLLSDAIREEGRRYSDLSVWLYDNVELILAGYFVVVRRFDSKL